MHGAAEDTATGRLVAKFHMRLPLQFFGDQPAPPCLPILMQLADVFDALDASNDEALAGQFEKGDIEQRMLQ